MGHPVSPEQQRAFVKAKQTQQQQHGNAGGAAVALGEVVEEIQAVERKAGVEVVTVHIPGGENCVADQLSRMGGEAHRQEVLKDGVVGHLNRQARGAWKRTTAVGYAQERSDVIVCAPAGDEYQRAVQVAELAAPCRPHILVVPKAVGDHWGKSGVKCRVMDRFSRGREIFVPQLPLQTEVRYSSGRWVFSLPRGRPILEE
uniref:Uncharacterized protein n=1 Tax=Chromera velia CCMP2878 TaxID=1169474 RepID=A0A0G4GLW5_9ALVE|eukprot:Cvel_22471.t1-p1 / transcript=Cvel_22471.t1 / gene=Cvel_22471 / organism=Chromera_velia_CCMP2878 / gene_product=hypothetical protein / transcript_product=hypothetical protein / location=Cvel_scaffold2212:4767-5366(-) / protein_length=200 / sequence_SO=supercontig / SO=protein_coding / is_pseudo=false